MFIFFYVPSHFALIDFVESSKTSRCATIKLISTELILYQLDNLSKFMTYQPLWEFRLLLMILKINFYCTSYLNNNNPQLNVALQSFDANRHFYEPILRALQRFGENLRVNDYHIENEKLSVFLVIVYYFSLIINFTKKKIFYI